MASNSISLTSVEEGSRAMDVYITRTSSRSLIALKNLMPSEDHNQHKNVSDHL